MKNHFKGCHFQKDIIIVAVGYYFRFSLSYREIVEILNDRGVKVNHPTVMRWVHFYGPLLKKMWKKKHKSSHQSWRMDETYLKIKGTWHYLYRAIDSHGVTLDFSLRKRRNFCSSYQFIKRLINNYGTPNCLVADKYGATLKAIRQLIKENYLTSNQHQCSKYRNNLIEQDHRLVKRTFIKSAGFQSFINASKTIVGIEVMHQLHKESQRKINFFGFSSIIVLNELLS